MFDNKRTLLKYGLNLSSFYVFSWFIHIIIISTVAFFHFRLDHQLIVIVNWIYDFSWQIYLVSKVIAFLIFFKFFIETSFSKVTEDILMPKRFSPLLSVIIFSLMNLGFILIVGKPKAIDNVLFSYGRSIIHGFTIALTFLIDLIVIRIYENDEVYEKVSSVFKMIIVSVIVFIYLTVILFNGKMLPISLLFLLLLNFSYFFLYDKSYIDSMTFCFLVIMPLFAFFGLDPVWQGKYSMFEFSRSSMHIPIIALAIVTITYKFLTNRKRSLN